MTYKQALGSLEAIASRLEAIASRLEAKRPADSWPNTIPGWDPAPSKHLDTQA